MPALISRRPSTSPIKAENIRASEGPLPRAPADASSTSYRTSSSASLKLTDVPANVAWYQAERRLATPRTYNRRIEHRVDRLALGGPIIGAAVSYRSRGSPMFRSSFSGLATSSAKNSPTVRPVIARTRPLRMKPYVTAW